MDKKSFCAGIGKVNAYALTIADLLDTVDRDHFDRTREGALKEYSDLCGGEGDSPALAWMDDHYDSVSAAVRAAMYLSREVYELTKTLWDEAEDLIPDGEDAGEKRNDG